jgi:glycosyltransferase involved in cell wall biosynthesis
MNNEDVIVLIPAHNEEASIQEVVRKACQYLPVLVVNDGSRDNTARFAEAGGAQVINHPVNQGKGAALKTGLAEALKKQYRAVITMDADGQHDPAEIPLFLDFYSRHPVGLVIGQRDFSRMPFLRKLSNTLGQKIISLALGRPIPDNQSGYRLLDRKLIEQVVDSKEEGFEFEVEMIAICLKNGLELGWVPIQTIYQGEKSHIRPLHHLVHFFRAVRNARQTLRRD